MQEKEFLQNYEIKNWNVSSRIYKILGISALANILAIAVIGQADLLTRKGCDSPFVSQICQVLDTVYVGTALFGTDAEFAIKDYEKTELADSDITYIDVSGATPPLKYPEGYFALANPEQFAMMQNTDFPMMPPPNYSGFPTTPPIQNGTNLLNTPQVVPTPNNNVITGTIPDSPFTTSGNPTIKIPKQPKIKIPKPPKIINNSPKELPKLDGDKTTADKIKKEPKQPDIASDPVSADVINKKPLQDFGDVVLEKVTKKEIDLTKNFLVEMQGTITDEGKFDRDPKKSRFVKTEGDQAMVDVAKSALEAIGDSGLLTYLKNLGIDKVNFTIQQDNDQIYVVIMSEQKTEQRANSISSGLNNLISLGKKTVKEEDTKMLLDAATSESKGKNFVLNFKLLKPIAQDMINRQLQKAEAKKKEAEKTKQPNSTAQTTNTNQETAK